jgi:P27 family predicted phage terminase small subunit
MSKPTPPPDHLSREAKSWFSAIARDFVLSEHDLIVLSAACEAWDRMNAARQLVAKDGMTFVDNRKAIRQHPAVAIEATARTQFLRAIRELNLPDPTDELRAKHGF